MTNTKEENKNANNCLKLKTRSKLLILDLKEGITVALPHSEIWNAMVLNVKKDGSFSAHWKDNWNRSGDFASELMKFDNDLVLDKNDKKERNKFRRERGLIEIE